jgi:hypothetical protein
MKILLLLATFPCALIAGPRTSANYTIITDTADGGGQRTATASYRIDGSAAVLAGSAQGAEARNDNAWNSLFGTIIGGFLIGTSIGQPVGGVPERENAALTAWSLLDDETYLRIEPHHVDWGLAVQPIVSISDGGVATAGSVFADTVGTVSASFAGFTAEADLPVLNVTTDDFGTYAGDGLADDWQVQYFGEDNPDAAPTLDPDGDEQTNLFEFTAGLVPTDPASLFELRIEPVAGQPSRRNIIFSPRFTDRSYSVRFAGGLDGIWGPLEDFAESDAGLERTVTDLDAADPAKFYRIEITKP